MRSLLIAALLAQSALPPAPPAAQIQTVVQPQEVRALPGHLDDVFMFNSNSPEVVKEPGILLSTFPPDEKKVPEAHLNRLFAGPFCLFFHHINNGIANPSPRTLHIGVLVYNPGRHPARVKLREAASYVSQPDAPFLALPPVQRNDGGKIYAGPGDRVMNDILRGRRRAPWPGKLTIAAGETKLIADLPIRVEKLKPPLNGRSALARLNTNQALYVALLAMFAPVDEKGHERPPTLSEWQALLKTGDLAGPRERPPTPPDSTKAIIYGRVSGVARGCRWLCTTSDFPGSRLEIPSPGRSFSYALSTVAGGTFGTGQIQSAPLVVRYADTAYQAHGNYGVEYDISLPLHNSGSNARSVAVAIQTPLKSDEAAPGLAFNVPPPERVYFRGTVQVSLKRGLFRHRQYWHLVQRQGEKGEPLATIKVRPGQTELVRLKFIYPPDSSPPQVLTVKTLDSEPGR